MRYGKCWPKEMNLDVEKKKVADFRQQLLVIQNQLQQLQQELVNRTYEPEGTPTTFGRNYSRKIRVGPSESGGRESGRTTPEIAMRSGKSDGNCVKNWSAWSFGLRILKR